ncbi:substrate-binding domain-containing protein [Bacillus shivajii]|uniref:substrate-binding domain-containing protein n=1 Tax=Bacillus shivajii TaxID=1983719 RepID=UPI001CFB0895|nr:substrate-binding domain-containing protein [Bacillus shivajii]UCZ53500.1 substrate-binding domain-containing protein [Bacillus shivajii]
MKHQMKLFLFSTLFFVLLTACNNATDEATASDEANIGGEMILSTTTSTYDSGLLDELIPIFEEQTGVNVKIIAVGSGQALAMGENGEADALLTHAPAAEEIIEEGGHVINRHRVMHNDFVVIGPVNDPANIEELTVDEAFQTIAEDQHLFYSRGDDSGTHKKEEEIWEVAGVSPEYDDYMETGQGMADTLRIAAEREGYTLTDRGTYLFLKEQLETLKILVEGDKYLENIYHVMQVNSELSDQINEEAAEAFVEFFRSEEVQSITGEYGIEKWGQPLFFNNQ